MSLLLSGVGDLPHAGRWVVSPPKAAASPEVERENTSVAPSSIEHVAKPEGSVIATHKALPAAENHTAAPGSGTPSLLRVAHKS